MLIHSSEHLDAHFVDRGGDRLLITFNEMGMVSDGTRFWGDDLAKHLGLSVAGFVSRRPNWFPAEFTHGAIARLTEILGDRFPERICYGLSQGAYAGLRYHGDLNASTVLAFSPQAALDPDVVKDPRFNPYFVRQHHADMLPDDIRHSADCFVFYDPKEKFDADHVEAIKKKIPLIEIVLPFCGHATIRPFAQRETIQALLDAAANRQTNALRRIANTVRKQSPTRPYLISLHIAKRHPKIALAIFEKYADMFHSEPWWNAAWRLGEEGYGASVIGWLTKESDRRENIASLQASTALVAVQVKQKEIALKYADRALKLEPENKTWAYARSRAENL